MVYCYKTTSCVRNRGRQRGFFGCDVFALGGEKPRGGLVLLILLLHVYMCVQRLYRVGILRNNKLCAAHFARYAISSADDEGSITVFVYLQIVHIIMHTYIHTYIREESFLKKTFFLPLTHGVVVVVVSTPAKFSPDLNIFLNECALLYEYSTKQTVVRGRSPRTKRHHQLCVYLFEQYNFCILF